MLSPSFTIPTARPTTYVLRGANILWRIFHDYFHAFADACDCFSAKDDGKFRLERISHAAERFESCGDSTKCIARIRGHAILHGTPRSSLAFGAQTPQAVWNISAPFRVRASIAWAGNCTAFAPPAVPLGGSLRGRG